MNKCTCGVEIIPAGSSWYPRFWYCEECKHPCDPPLKDRSWKETPGEREGKLWKRIIMGTE